MLLDTELQDLASRTLLPDAEAAAEKTKASLASAEAARDGLKVELSSARNSLMNWQRRLHADPPDATATLLKLSVGSSKTSVVAAGEMYARHESEQRVVRGVIALKERAVTDAQARLAAGEVDCMRADLAHQEAAVIVLAIRHLEAAKHLTATDDEIDEVPFGPRIEDALSAIAQQTLTLARKERGPQ